MNQTAIEPVIVLTKPFLLRETTPIYCMELRRYWQAATCGVMGRQRPRSGFAGASQYEGSSPPRSPSVDPLKDHDGRVVRDLYQVAEHFLGMSETSFSPLPNHGEDPTLGRKIKRMIR